MYLTQCLHRSVQRFPERLAVVDGPHSWTWAELADRSARFAAAMGQLGVTPGDRIAILSGNSRHFVEYLFGTWWSGAVINPINLRWTVQEIAYSLEDCAATVLLVDETYDDYVPALRSAVPKLTNILSIGESTRHGLVPRSQWLQPQVEATADMLRGGDDLAALMYTGGTTGRAKGVMLSHTNIAFSVLGSLSLPELSPGPTVLHSAPLFHIGGLAAFLLAATVGSTCIMLPAFEPLSVIQAIEHYAISDLFLVPTMLRLLLDHPRFGEFDTSSVRIIRYGASSMGPSLMDRLLEAFPGVRFNQSYGMTELSPTCCVLLPEDHSREACLDGRGRSAGRATMSCEVKIFGPGEIECPRGVAGEVVARGPTVMQGYWNRPEDTVAAVRNGWMHTGDIGIMDERGYVTIVDRLKDMIVTGGENVYSAEVEAAVSSFEAVAAVAVIGLPDEKWGERVHAVIVPRDNAEIELATLQAHCRRTLAGYKIPRSMSVTSALPLSGAGKVLKTDLRRQFAEDGDTR